LQSEFPKYTVGQGHEGWLGRLRGKPGGGCAPPPVCMLKNALDRSRWIQVSVRYVIRRVFYFWERYVRTITYSILAYRYAYPRAMHQMKMQQFTVNGKFQ